MFQIYVEKMQDTTSDVKIRILKRWIPNQSLFVLKNAFHNCSPFACPIQLKQTQDLSLLNTMQIPKY